MPTPAIIQSIIDQSLVFIAQQQEKSGRFRDTNGTAALFYSALIAATLPSLSTIGKKTIAFLLQQQHTDFSWNYWSMEEKSPYPNDLDDTFVALQAIANYAPGYLDEVAWKAVMSLLIQNEVQPGGPYYTWITEHEGIWNNIDIVVNSNIAIFLQSQHIKLPGLSAFFDSAILENNLTSYYYDKEYIVIYFLVKAYEGPHKDRLIKSILQNRNKKGYWETPLENAYAISSLLRLGENPAIVAPAVQQLIRTSHHGTWQPSSLFIDHQRNNTITYAYCDAYVSTCCVEALTLYLNALADHQQNDQQFVETVIAACKSQFSRLSSSIQKQFMTLLDVTLAKDPKKEIVLLPFYFASRLSAPVEEKVVLSLAMANVLGWIGYSIKDAIQDGESKKEFLSIATLCIRKSIQLFHTCATPYFSEKDIDDILDTIEESLLWEQEHCHLEARPLSDHLYGDRMILAQKSFGHALGPLILTSLSKDKSQIEYVRTFFQHYLIARQMNDDAHDWPEDLQNGYLNSASSIFLTNKNCRQPLTTLRELFWKKHVDTVCTLILDHIEQARSVIQNITILSDSDVLEQLLIPLEQSCKQAIQERDRTRRLLKLMQSP